MGEDKQKEAINLVETVGPPKELPEDSEGESHDSNDDFPMPETGRKTTVALQPFLLQQAIEAQAFSALVGDEEVEAASKLTVNTIVMKMCRLVYSDDVDEAAKLSVKVALLKALEQEGTAAIAAAKAAATAKQQEEAAATAKQREVVEAFANAAKLAKASTTLPPLTVQPPKPPAAQAANKLLMKLNMSRTQGSSGSSANANKVVQWSLENTAVLGVPGYEKTVEGKIQWLSESQHTSVAATVESLNTRKVVSIRGYCIMFSRSLGRYVLLYRTDKKADALKALKWSESSQATYVAPA